MPLPFGATAVTGIPALLGSGTVLQQGSKLCYRILCNMSNMYCFIPGLQHALFLESTVLQAINVQLLLSSFPLFYSHQKNLSFVRILLLNKPIVCTSLYLFE